jgi:hypothetical protein
MKKKHRNMTTNWTLSNIIITIDSYVCLKGYGERVS